MERQQGAPEDRGKAACRRQDCGNLAVEGSRREDKASWPRRRRRSNQARRRPENRKSLLAGQLPVQPRCEQTEQPGQAEQAKPAKPEVEDAWRRRILGPNPKQTEKWCLRRLWPRRECCQKQQPRQVQLHDIRPLQRGRRAGGTMTAAIANGGRLSDDT